MEKLKFILDIQLFAEYDDEIDESDFEDEEEQSKKQDREKNAEQARIRREKEQKEREEKIKKEAFEQGKKQALLEAQKINPFTETEINDEYDLEVLNIQKKIKESGGDPLKDLPKELAKKRREEAQKREEKSNEDEKINSDIKEFSEENPDIDVKKLLENEDFKDYCEGKLGKKPLKEIYAKFMKLKGNDNLLKEAIRMSNSGSSSTKKTVKKGLDDLTGEAYFKAKKELDGDYF